VNIGVRDLRVGNYNGMQLFLANIRITSLFLLICGSDRLNCVILNLKEKGGVKLADNQEHKSQELMTEDIVKEYSTEDLTVYWNPKVCSHPGYCWQGLPKVFDPARRPWVDLKAASPEEIIKIIDTCPTGALMYDLPEGSKVDPGIARGPGWVQFKKSEPAVTRIKVARNGPLVVEGPSEVYDAEGKLIKKYHQFAFCRCGLSLKQPFCDGAHFKQGWKEK